MSSSDYLPKDPNNTTGVNNTGHADHEQLRYDFLRRFLEHPSLFSVVLTVKQYLNTPTLNTSGVFDFAYTSKVWRKDGVMKEINKTELFTKICNFETESFCRDVSLVLMDDISYNITEKRNEIDAQLAIINDETSTQEQIDTAIITKENAELDYFKYTNMKNRLEQYTTDFLNYNTITNEIINTLAVLMAVDA